MSKYVDDLRKRSDTNPDLCQMGWVLEEHGREEYDAIMEAIFATDDEGKFYPAPWLVDEFKDQYGWSIHFFRRHRRGECQSCKSRTTTPNA